MLTIRNVSHCTRMYLMSSPIPMQTQFKAGPVKDKHNTKASPALMQIQYLSNPSTNTSPVPRQAQYSGTKTSPVPRQAQYQGKPSPVPSPVFSRAQSWVKPVLSKAQSRPRPVYIFRVTQDRERSEQSTDEQRANSVQP
jgi:hypothetical protein